MTGDRVIVGFDGSKSSTTLALTIRDINTDALRQIYGAEHFDTKGDYIMPSHRFKKGDRVKYVGRDPETTTPELEGHVGTVQHAAADMITVAWDNPPRRRGTRTGILPTNLERIATVEPVFVLDQNGLAGLPAGTKIRIADQKRLKRSVNGHWMWRDADNLTWHGNVPRTAFHDSWFPAEVLNPELMGEFKAPEPKFSAGDIVVYSVDNEIWHGRRCRVVSVEPSRNPAGPSLLVESLDHSWPQTYLPARYFRPFDPKTDFRLGDTVRFKGNLSSLGTGVITTFYGANGVRDTRVMVGNVGYRVDRVGLELVAAKPEPIREEFNLTGAYVADRAGLDALPVGAVIERLHATGYSPLIKLATVGVTAEWHYLWPTTGSSNQVAREVERDVIPGYVVKHVPGEFPAAA